MNQKRFIGLIIILVGGLLLLSSLGVIQDAGDIWRDYWPLILIAIGVVNVFGQNGIRYSGIILIVIGTLFLMENLNFINIDVWQLIVPALVILVGLWFLLPKRENKPNSRHYVRQMAFFSGAEIACDSNEFKGADLTVAFGGIDLDLRHVELSEERPAKIDMFVAFGGIDVIVPEGMRVRVTGIPLFGGWSNRAVKVPSAEEADIVVNAFVMFGGMEVKSKQIRD